MSKVKTGIVDKNGRFTHVWKNPDIAGSIKTYDADNRVVTQFMPLASDSSTSDFKGIIYSGSGAHVTTKDGRSIELDIPTLGALTNKLLEYPTEWGVPGSANTFDWLNDRVRAGYDDGEFFIEDRSEGIVSLDKYEVRLLGSSADLYMQTARPLHGWSQTHGYVNVVESPVSDRDANYYITLGDDAMITTYIKDSGLADEENQFGYGDRDQVTFYRDGDSGDSIKIQVSYTDDIDMSDIIDNLDQDELDSYTADINRKLAEIDPNLVANFDSPEDVIILFNATSDNLSPETPDGTLTFTTSNVLPDFSELEHLNNVNRAWQIIYTAAEGR